MVESQFSYGRLTGGNVWVGIGRGPVFAEAWPVDIRRLSGGIGKVIEMTVHWSSGMGKGHSRWKKVNELDHSCVPV